MRFLLTRSLILLTAAAMLSVAGCSDGSKKEPLSMDDALATIEEARKDTQTPTEIPDPDPEEPEADSEEDLLDSNAMDVPKTGVIHSQGRVISRRLHNRSPSRLGSHRGRAFLSTREGRILRRVPLFSSRARIHGTVRDQRRSCGTHEMGSKHQGRCGLTK